MQNPSEFTPESWLELANRFEENRVPVREVKPNVCDGKRVFEQQLATGGALSIEHLLHRAQLSDEGVGPLLRVRILETETKSRLEGTRFRLGVLESKAGYDLALIWREKGTLKNLITVGGVWMMPNRSPSGPVGYETDAPVRTLETIRDSFQRNISPCSTAESYMHPEEELERAADFIEIFGVVPERASAVEIAAKLTALFNAGDREHDRLIYATELAQPYVVESLRDLRHKKSRNAVLNGQLTLKGLSLRQRLQAWLRVL